MGIRDLLIEVATKYDMSAGVGKDVPGQMVLREVHRRSDLILPPGFAAKGHGGNGGAAASPWIELFNPEINTDPKRGLYLAYIFSADLKSVFLTLQQGVTSLEGRLGKGELRQQHLRQSAARLRKAVSRQRRQGWVDEPSLGSRVTRPRAYEAASVIARGYSIKALPNEVDLEADLLTAVPILKQTAPLAEAWWSGDAPRSVEVGFVPDPHGGSDDPLADFVLKDSSDYTSEIKERQQVKRRHHESLIGDFAKHVAACDYRPITRQQHPRDLILKTQGGATDEWLVEAKVIRDGNSTDAVRQAVGQLYEYSYYLYRQKQEAEPHLIGLFSSDIGAHAQYLEHRGIASIWRSGQGWGGSSLADKWKMLS